MRVCVAFCATPSFVSSFPSVFLLFILLGFFTTQKAQLSQLVFKMALQSWTYMIMGCVRLIHIYAYYICFVLNGINHMWSHQKQLTATVCLSASFLLVLLRQQNINMAKSVSLNAVPWKSKKYALKVCCFSTFWRQILVFIHGVNFLRNKVR